MIVRPLAETQKILGLDNLYKIINIFVPRQCDFILNSDILSKFRINSLLNEKIKEDYNNKVNENLTKLNITNGNELIKLQNMLTKPSLNYFL